LKDPGARLALQLGSLTLEKGEPDDEVEHP
jgi:hypothetical protein